MAYKIVNRYGQNSKWEPTARPYLTKTWKVSSKEERLIEAINGKVLGNVKPRMRQIHPKKK